MKCPATCAGALAFAVILGCGDQRSVDSSSTALNEKNARTTESGLKIEDVKVGSGEEARTGSVVQVHYTGWVFNGKKFDSSFDRQRPFTVTVGAGKVIKGWDEGLVGMKEGGKRRLQIPAELGYGSRGRGATIPPGSTLVFELDLIHVNPGVKIEEIKEGKGEPAKLGDDIVVHYTGTLTDGKKFESTMDRKQPLRLTLGRDEVIPGWEAGVVGMKAGGKRKLTIPPNMAYGEGGRGSVIPPNATLLFDVEMVEIIPADGPPGK